MGHPHSEALRVTERYHRRDFGHMDVEMTFDDPKDVHQAVHHQGLHELGHSDIFEFSQKKNQVPKTVGN